MCCSARTWTFLAEYVDGAQTPEPGAPCTGGVGEPLTPSAA
jgi:hypothetical protein